MKFYFGQVPERDVETFGAEGLYYNEDNYYYYCVEFGSNPGGVDDIVLRDTAGRMVPVATQYMLELATILAECNNIYCELENARALVQELENLEGTASVVGDNINYD